MAAIKQHISKGQLVALLFSQVGLAASQTNVQLKLVEAGANVLANDEYVMPWDGEVVGISWTLSAAGSAGNLSIGVSRNGTEDADTTQAVTTAQRGSKPIGRGKMPFVTGDQIGVEITTDGSWNGTASDLAVVVWALVYLEKV
jgi:hypothetical protein